jgi:hypothetical protein
MVIILEKKLSVKGGKGVFLPAADKGILPHATYAVNG